jgi:hypothetical protein
MVTRAAGGGAPLLELEEVSECTGKCDIATEKRRVEGNKSLDCRGNDTM